MEATDMVKGGMAVAAVGLALFVAGCGGATTTSTKTTPSSTATPKATATATPKATPTPSGPIFQQSGNGITDTQEFHAPGKWKLVWSYNCAAFGGSGNFIVTVQQGSQPDFNDASGPNELGAGGSGTTYFYSGGTLNLSIDSECAWTVAVDPA